jgi:alpha-tubulin suppressor-like RCC1 family protein
MILRPAIFSTAAVVVCALSCQSEKDSYVVLHTDVNCDVPRVYQLRVTVINPGTPEFQKVIPDAASAELGFPNSTVLILASSHSGSVQVQVEALDNKFTLVGSGSVSGQIVVGGRIDLNVQLGVLANAPGSSGSVDGGQSGDVDGGTTGASELGAAGSGVPFVQVAVGKESTCAIRSDSSLWCWGGNSNKQLLLPSTLNRLTPVAVGVGAIWNQVACGQSHSCGISNQAALSCWGNNGTGQLGAAPASAGGQADVPGGPWQSVATGLYQTCAIKQDGTLWCWGDNTNGTLGTGDTNPSAVPFQVTGQGWNQVSSNYLHTCAVRTDGTLWCWGLNANLEAGTTSQFPWSPVQLAGTTWTQVTTGLYHTCAIKTDGTLWCWGGNLSGQLGNDGIPVLPTSQTSDPVQVTGTTWQSVSAGQSHTCAIMLDGTLWCWGSNTSGQLGDNTLDSKSTPVAVGTSGQTWAMVAAGVTHTCALAMGGSLWCWGDNTAGQLGIGSNGAREIPTRVAQ